MNMNKRFGNYLVSVIIPIYNSERHLRQTLESVVNQSHRNIEIICVNDGSVDSSKSIVDEYASKDSRVVACHCENMGVSLARNLGMIKSSGDYICFLDADDIASPRMYERLLELAVGYEADISELSYVKVPDGYEFGKVLDDSKMQTLPGYRGLMVSTSPWELFVKNHKKYTGGLISPVWHRMFRADLAKKCFFLKGIQPGEDTFFNLLAFLHAKKYVCSDEIGLLYRQNKDSVSNGNWRKVVKKNLDARIKVAEWFLSNRQDVGFRYLKALLACVDRELVYWPLKAYSRYGTREECRDLAKLFLSLRKRRILSFLNLSLSKMLKMMWFIVYYRY